LQGYPPVHDYEAHLSTHFRPAPQAAGPHMVTGFSPAMPPVSAQIPPARFSAIPPSAHTLQPTFPPPPITSRAPVTNSAQLLSLLNGNKHAPAPAPVNAGYR
jgi:hypothetical protein